jgi:organic radical activating enzyme|tara:strand:- start:2422 stop:3189 length:768 start_codon:yes stop_codon:yes gene_type:complete
MIDCDKEYLLLAGENGEPEVFYTIEGEGAFIGQPSVFLRLFGCNLTCSGFISEDSPYGCDSYISWSKKNKVTFNELFKLLDDNNYIERLKQGAIFKYTGGEPMVRQGQLLKFTEAFVDHYKFIPRIDFETNATIQPDEEWVNKWNATFTTSPKLTTNGDPENKTYKPAVLKWHVDHGSGFKFVINVAEDIEEIWRKYVEDPAVGVPLDRIWFMPCCGSRAEHQEKVYAVAEYAKAMNVNFSPRLHLVIWDKALRV